MAFVCILCGVLQVLLLLSVTGVLVSLAAMSRLMELAFILVQPTVLFMLRQSVSLIVFWIVLSLRRTSIVLGKICSRQPSDSGSPIDCPFTDGELKIGTTPICVPYSSRPYESEQLVGGEKKNSLPVVPQLGSSEENVEVISSASTKSAATLELALKASRISFSQSRQSSQHSADEDDRRDGVNSSEEA